MLHKAPFPGLRFILIDPISATSISLQEGEANQVMGLLAIKLPRSSSWMIRAIEILKRSRKRNNERPPHFLEVNKSELPEATLNLWYETVMDKY